MVELYCSSDFHWIENFQMSQQTFNHLCQMLSPYIKKQTTKMHTLLSVQKHVAITLWFLATPVEYRTIGHLFSIARSTVCVVVHETCSVIVKVLLTRYIHFPRGDDLTNVVDGFERVWELPQYTGAIDGSYIPISAPTMNHTDYYNRKGYYSVVIQAVLDYRYLFLDIYTGWPGSVHDTRVFSHSSIYKSCSDGTLLPKSTKIIEEIDVPLYLVGDSAYPLLTWLMKPFPHNSNLSQDQKNFNYHLSRARIVVENAFGLLKARWRRLLKRLDMDVNKIPAVF